MLLTNINHIHRIVINKHATLASVLGQPGIHHQWVVSAISDIMDMEKDPQVDKIEFDQVIHDIHATWTVGQPISPPPTTHALGEGQFARRPPLKQIFSTLRDQPSMDVSTPHPLAPFWLKHPKLWRRAAGYEAMEEDNEPKEDKKEEEHAAV